MTSPEGMATTAMHGQLSPPYISVQSQSNAAKDPMQFFCRVLVGYPFSVVWKPGRNNGRIFSRQTESEEELCTDIGTPVEVDIAARTLRDVRKEIGVVGELNVAADRVFEPVVVEVLRETVGAGADRDRVRTVDVAAEVT